MWAHNEKCLNFFRAFYSAFNLFFYLVKELLNSCGWMNVSDQICNVSVIIVQYQVRPEDSTRRSYSKNK